MTHASSPIFTAHMPDGRPAPYCLGLEDAAEFVGMSPDALRQATYRRQVPVCTHTKPHRYLLPDLVRWLERHSRKELNHDDSANAGIPEPLLRAARRRGRRSDAA